jgi:DNA invertase Pin-like site-specific DNA recombinase
MKRLVTGHPRVAVAYLRASTDEQRLSAAAQRSHIRAWAARERISVVGWYVDRGVCSVTPIVERRALQAALAAVDARRAGVLVVARRDRIARDVVLACEVERAAARAGARVVSATGEGNGDSPADAFLRTVIDGAAQYEHWLVRARTRAALAAKRERRERVGAIPYGFALAFDGVHLVAARAEQATIARARELRMTGLSLRTVAAVLASEGRVSRKGRPFLATQVARMVRTRTPRKWVTAHGRA